VLACTHTHTHIHTHTHTCTHTHIYTHTYTHRRAHTHTRTHTHTHIHTHTHMHTHGTRTRTHTHAHAHTHTHAHAWAREHAYAHVWAYTHTHAHARLPALTHASLYAYVRTCTSHTHTHKLQAYTAGRDGTLRLWNYQTQECIRVLLVRETVRSMVRRVCSRQYQILGFSDQILTFTPVYLGIGPHTINFKSCFLCGDHLLHALSRKRMRPTLYVITCAC